MPEKTSAFCSILLDEHHRKVMKHYFLHFISFTLPSELYYIKEKKNRFLKAIPECLWQVNKWSDILHIYRRLIAYVIAAARSGSNKVVFALWRGVAYHFKHCATSLAICCISKCWCVMQYNGWFPASN